MHSQWCSVLAELQSPAFMVCLLLFSVGSVQSSIQLSVESIEFSVILVSAVFRALAVHQESVMLCHVQSPHLECPLPQHSS